MGIDIYMASLKKVMGLLPAFNMGDNGVLELVQNPYGFAQALGKIVQIGLKSGPVFPQNSRKVCQ
jgi:hypothetical protein